MTKEKDELSLFFLRLIKAGAKVTEDNAVREAKEKDDPFGVAMARGMGGFVETWLDNVEGDIKSKKRRR